MVLRAIGAVSHSCSPALSGEALNQRGSEKMIKALMVVAFVLVAMGVTYYQANKQLSFAYGECMLELDFQERLMHSESEGDIRFLFGQVVACVDKRKGPLAGLVFDREKAVASMEAMYSKGGFKAVAELMQMTAEYEDMQTQMDAANDTRAFREGAYGRKND